MKTPDKLTEELKRVLGESLKSVILYGSSANEDKTQIHSDFNILVVVETLDLPTLKALSSISKKWVKAGHPMPLYFEKSALINSADVFPIEFIDMKESHKVIFGEDIISLLKIGKQNYRHQLEYELRAKQIQFRLKFIEADGQAKDLQWLLTKSFSQFLVLFRATLHLVEIQVPEKRKDQLHHLKKHLSIDVEAWEKIHDLRENPQQLKLEELELLFSKMLESIQNVVLFVNNFNQQK